MQAVFLIQSLIQLFQFYFQMLPKVLRQLGGITPVYILVGRLPVRVGTFDYIRVGRQAYAVGVCVYRSADRCLFGLHEQFFIIVQFPVLVAVLLQENQVAAHFRVRVLREEVVRQAGYAHQVGMTHHVLAYGRVGRGIQHTLRGDECHDAALTHRIKAFQEEVVVYRLRRRTPCGVLAARKFRVKHSHVTERDVGDCQVKIVVEGLLYLLETLYPHLMVGVQVFQYLAREQILLERHHVGIRAVVQHRIHKGTHACRRLQHPVGAYAVFVQHVRDGTGYLRRGVESGEDGAFQAVHIPLVFVIVIAVFPDEPVQLHRRGKKFEVRFCPMDGIRQFLCGIEYEFQSPETAEPFQKQALACRGRAPLPVKDECRP